MLSKIKNIEKLFEEYKFDYIYINPKNIKDFDFDPNPEDLVDGGTPNFLSTILDHKIEVYWNPKIEVGYAELKYKNLKKERKIKIQDLLK